MRPLLGTLAVSSDLQAMTSPGISSMMREVHSTMESAGPFTFQCDLVASRICTLSMLSMNSGRLRKSRQKS
jgi:hypothetical protein